MHSIKLAGMGIVWLASTLAWGESQEPPRDLLSLDLETLMTIEIGPSADASQQGLSPLLPGGQLAGGGRLGFLGTYSDLYTPFSVTRYSQDFIRDRQAASVGDVLQYDPAVRVSRGFGNFQQLYLIRGLPLFSDDMAYNGLYGILPRQYLAAELIERVDVLRGVSTTLSGTTPGSALGSGLGGSVNVLPKRAPKQDLTDLTLGYQSDGIAMASADVGRRSDDQRWGLRLNGALREGDTAEDGESVSLTLATAGLDFRGERSRLSMDLGFQEHELDATSPSVEVAPGLKIPKAPDAGAAIAQPWTGSRETDLFATLRAELDFTSQLMGWIAAGTRHGDESSLTSAFLTVQDDSGDFTASPFQVERRDQVRTGDTGLRLTLSTGPIRHQLSLSASAYDFDTRNAFVVFDACQGNLYQPEPLAFPARESFSAGDMAHPRTTQAQQLTSIALADHISLPGDRWQLLLGLRHQRIEDETYAYGSGERLSRYDESALAPVAAVLYHMTTAWSAYVNYAQGLEQGELVPDVNGAGPVSNRGASLAPYAVGQWETGVKYRGDSLGGDLALFRLRRPLTQYNADNARVEQGVDIHQGLELRGFGELPGRLRWLGGVTVLDTGSDHGNGNDHDNHDLIGAPHWQGNLNLEWDVAAVQGLTFTGHVTATGSQYADAANQQKVPGWHRLDLGLRQLWSLDHGKTLVLRANLLNVSDRDQWVAVGGYPGFGYLIPGQPRSLILSTQLRF